MTGMTYQRKARFAAFAKLLVLSVGVVLVITTGYVVIAVVRGFAAAVKHSDAAKHVGPRPFILAFLKRPFTTAATLDHAEQANAQLAAQGGA